MHTWNKEIHESIQDGGQLTDTGLGTDQSPRGEVTVWPPCASRGPSASVSSPVKRSWPAYSLSCGRKSAQGALVTKGRAQEAREGGRGQGRLAGKGSGHRTPRWWGWRTQDRRAGRGQARVPTSWTTGASQHLKVDLSKPLTSSNSFRDRCSLRAQPPGRVRNSLHVRTTCAPPRGCRRPRRRAPGTSPGSRPQRLASPR